MLFDVDLNNRQQKILESLTKYDSRVFLPKKSVSMRDLSALTAKTGNEFAMFTKGNERLIVRGDINNVNISLAKAKDLYEQGYKWSGHTHPGVDQFCLISSSGDEEILKVFNQKESVIYNSKGLYSIFGKR